MGFNLMPATAERIALAIASSIALVVPPTVKSHVANLSDARASYKKHIHA